MASAETGPTTLGGRMRDSVKTGLLVGIMLAILGSLGWLWFKNNFERREKTVRSAMSIEARRNPLLAAEMFLTRLGLTVESRSGREYLLQPPEDLGLLMVRDLGPPLTEGAITNLLDWVERGGHLLAAPSAQLQEGGQDGLLKKFGVSLQLLDDEESDETIQRLNLPGVAERLQIELGLNRRFEVDEHSAAVSPLVKTPGFLMFPWGAGSITLISDSDLFTNSRIGEHDHAVLLAQIAADEGHVWLLHRAEMPSLLSLIWRSAPQLLLTLLLLGFISAWWMSRSSGPKLVISQSGRRDLLEHLQASAEFVWRYDLKTALLEGARYQVEKRWLSAHPVLLQLDAEARCEWLAKRTDLNATAIFKALYPDQLDTTQMIKNSINLQRLLAALHPDRKVK
ncbi:MAG: DUF4350 domain-containing protein [Candidatus Thiodiazotropha sp.]